MNTKPIIGANGNPTVGDGSFQKQFPTLPRFWGPLIRRLNLGRSAFLARGSTFDPGRLVVVEVDRVLKLVIDVESQTAQQRNQNLSGEHEILDRLKGISGIPRPISFVELEVGSFFEMERVPGDSRPGVPSNGSN